MATKNDITGDKIQSRPTNKAYADQWDRIYNPQGTHYETQGKDQPQAKEESQTKEQT